LQTARFVPSVCLYGQTTAVLYEFIQQAQALQPFLYAFFQAGKLKKEKSKENEK